MGTDKAPAQANDASNGDGRSRPPAPHVLLVPYPAQGHMLPLLDLASLLAARGLAVTVAVTAGNVPLLAPLLAAGPSVATAVFPFPASSPPFLPASGTGCGENTKDLPPGLFRPFMAALASLSAPLLSWCEAQPRGRRVTAVVSDLFTGWTLPIARELGVPHVAFSSTSAYYLAMSHSLWRRMPTGCRLDEDDDDEKRAVVEFPEIPGSPSFPWQQLSWLYRSHVAGDEVSETIRRVFLWSLKSSCFVVNSFAAIEPECLRVLPGLMMMPPAAEEKRVLAVGALSDAALSCHDRGGEHAVAPGKVAAWLDAFEDSAGSVLYVCFGSQHALSPAQAASVADALALSKAPFVWAVPRGSEAITAMAASVCRGMVIRGWAPQVEILRHRAVGWFLTHCGWSSVLEAAAAGVPMLGWPMGADQFANARVVRDAGVAVAVAEGTDAVPDAGEMAGAIVAAFGEKGKPVRARALELGRKAAAAVKEGGSSHSDLEELVRVLGHVG